MIESNAVYFGQGSYYLRLLQGVRLNKRYLQGFLGKAGSITDTVLKIRRKKIKKNLEPDAFSDKQYCEN